MRASPSLRRAAVALALGLLVGPAAASAQHRHPPQPWERRSSTGISVGGDAVVALLRSDVDARVGDGVGYDAHVDLGISALGIGLGFQRTSHDRDSASPAVYRTFYVEPRLILDLGGANFRPYVAGRAGRTEESIETTAVTARRTGTSLGLGGGLLVDLTSNAAVDLGGFWSTLAFGARSGQDTDFIRRGEVRGTTLRIGLRLTP